MGRGFERLRRCAPSSSSVSSRQSSGPSSKLISPILGYSQRAKKGTPGGLKRYDSADIAAALTKRNLDPFAAEEHITLLEEYSNARADLLEQIVEPNLMDRDQAAELFETIRARDDPPELLLSHERAEGRSEALRLPLVHREHADLRGADGDVRPRNVQPKSSRSAEPSPATAFRCGTLFRWMDGAYPDVNRPHAAWEVKEYYGTTSFGSRVADGVYESALDGYELNDLRDVGVEVEHYLFLDDRKTWWKDGQVQPMPDRGHAPRRTPRRRLLRPRGRGRVAAGRQGLAGAAITR